VSKREAGEQQHARSGCEWACVFWGVQVRSAGVSAGFRGGQRNIEGTGHPLLTLVLRRSILNRGG